MSIVLKVSCRLINAKTVTLCTVLRSINNPLQASREGEKAHIKYNKSTTCVIVNQNDIDIVRTGTLGEAAENFTATQW